MNIRFIRTTLATTFAVLLCGALAACGSSSTKRADGKPLRTVKVLLDWTPNTNHSGLYLAKERGWYRDAGLDVQIIEPGNGADVLTMVGNDSVDFGVSASEQLVPARAQGVPVVSVAAIIEHNTSSLVALRSSGITTLADLPGRTYGAFGGGFEKALVDALVACGGGDPKDVTFKEVGDTDFRQGMTRKQFDFVWVFDAWDTIRLRDLDHLDLSHFAFRDHTDCIPDWYTPVLVTSERHITADPKMVQAFMSATARGYREAMHDPKAAAAALLHAAPELDSALVERSAAWLAPRYASDPDAWGRQTAATWNRFVAFLVTNKLVKADFATAAAWTDRFLPPPGGAHTS